MVTSLTSTPVSSFRSIRLASDVLLNNASDLTLRTIFASFVQAEDMLEKRAYVPAESIGVLSFPW